MPLLSEQNVSTVTTDGFLHIIRPDGAGGWDSYQIAIANLEAGLQAQIDAITAVIGVKRTDLAQSATFNFAQAAGTKLVSIDIQAVSGTVNVDIGTTPGGTDIAEGFDFSTGVEGFTLNKTYDGAETIYITRNSGTFNLITYYIEGWLS